MEWNQLFLTLGLDAEKAMVLVPTIYLLVTSFKKLFPQVFGSEAQWQTRVLSFVITVIVVVVNYIGVPNLPIPVQLGLIAILLWLLTDGFHHVTGIFKKQ